MEQTTNNLENYNYNGTHFDLFLIFKNYIYSNTISYFLPFAIALSLINNIIIIGIFLKSKTVIHHIANAMRIYYMAIAISDINVSLSLPLAYFLGTC